MSDKTPWALLAALLTFLIVDVYLSSILQNYIPNPGAAILSAALALLTALTAFAVAFVVPAFVGAVVTMALARAGGLIRPKTGLELVEMKLLSIPFSDMHSSTHLVLNLRSKGSIVIRSINIELGFVGDRIPMVELTNYLSTAGKRPISQTSEQVIPNIEQQVMGWSKTVDYESVSEERMDDLELTKRQNLYVYYPTPIDRVSDDIENEVTQTVRRSLRPVPRTSYWVSIMGDGIDYGGNSTTLTSTKKVTFVETTQD